MRCVLRAGVRVQVPGATSPWARAAPDAGGPARAHWWLACTLCTCVLGASKARGLCLLTVYFRCSSDESSDEEVAAKAKKAPAKKTPEPKQAAKKDESSDEDSDSDDSEDEKPAAKKAAPAKKAAEPKKAAKKDESSDENSDSDDSEDEKPAAKKAAPAKKAAAKKEESSDEDSDSDSEDEKPAKKAAPAKKVEAKKAAAKKEESSDEDSDSESEDEKPAAKKAKAADGKAVKSKKADSDSDESDSDEDDDEEMKTNNKRKAPEAEDKAGANTRVFLGGLPFKATEKDIKDMFGKCGKIDKVELPMNAEGRPAGFGFVTFKDVAAVAKAVEMDGQEMMSRWIKVKEADGNDGKPKFGGTPNGAPKPKPEGCTSIFMGNLSWDVDEDTIRSFFAECGEITSVRFATDRDTGDFKGFGHVSFAESDATDLAVAKAGEFVAGRAIRVDFAEDRKPGGGGGGGGRGGFGGGRGGRGGGRGGFGGGDRSPAPVNKNRGSIQASQGTKISFDD